MKKLLLIVSAVLFLVYSIEAQYNKENYISLELDPAPFILGGYSFSLKYSPKAMPKTAFMASVYSSDFPNSMMRKANKDKGWTDLSLETSYAIFADYFLKKERKGFYFGPSVFLYNKSVEFSPVNERIDFTTIYPNVRVGYAWYPFKNIDLYINPWLNIGSEINVDTQNELIGVTFESHKFYYIVALHIGYSFQW